MWPVTDPILPDGRDGGRGQVGRRQGVALCGPVTLLPASSAASPRGRGPSVFCLLGPEETRELPVLGSCHAYLKPGQGRVSKLLMQWGTPITEARRPHSHLAHWSP